MRSSRASATGMNAAVSALRFFFTVTLGRGDAQAGMTTVREPRRLPVVSSPEEVARLLDAAQCSSPGGLKYRAALSVAYGAGPRGTARLEATASPRLTRPPSTPKAKTSNPHRPNRPHRPRLIPPRFPPLRLVRRLPAEFAPQAQSRQASDNPSPGQTFERHVMAVRSVRRSRRSVGYGGSGRWSCPDPPVETSASSGAGCSG